MGGVLTEATATADKLLRRGVTERWTVRCEQDRGQGFVPQDLSGWTGVVVIEGSFGEEWLTLPVSTDPVALKDGFATVTVPASTLTDVVWAGRKSGSWRMDMTAPDGHVERLGDGAIRIE
jgi:hypothetical protein